MERLTWVPLTLAVILAAALILAELAATLAAILAEVIPVATLEDQTTVAELVAIPADLMTVAATTAAPAVARTTATATATKAHRAIPNPTTTLRTARIQDKATLGKAEENDIQ